jgi:CRISPR-associated protein Csb2
MGLVKPPSAIAKSTGQIIRYAITGKHPPLAATVAVAEAFRSAVLSAFHALTGSKESFLLSGHHSDGKPDGEHRHAYYLPQPDGAGRIREMLVVSPFDRFSQEELVALQTVRAIRWNGPSAMAHLELLDSDDWGAVKLASRWVSLTPYVPTRRFWGTHGKHHLTPDRQLVVEIKRVLPECIVEDVKLMQCIDIRIRVASNSKTKLPDSPVRRGAYSVEFRTQQPLCAPIALGHSCHFGLGQFLPS